MRTYKFCYHWAQFGGTGYVLADTVEQAISAIKERYPQYDEMPSVATLTLSTPINQ
jgi:hypothetical protein